LFVYWLLQFEVGDAFLPNVASFSNNYTYLLDDKPLSCRIPSSRMLRRVALVRTDVSEELSVSISRVTRIDEL
jgi:hypothetical protein